eukprot:Gb_04420 [translate_table: standard]
MAVSSLLLFSRTSRQIKTREFVKFIHCATKPNIVSPTSLNLSLPIAQITRLEYEGNNIPSILADEISVCEEGRLNMALGVLNGVDQLGITVDCKTYVSLLQDCANTRALAEGKSVHAHMLINALDQDVLRTQLVIMYAKCGSLVDARQVFDKIPKQTVFLWNEMIRGYARNGLCEEAINLYHQMQRVNVEPDNFTFPCVLKACAGLADLQQGKEVHDYIIRRRFESDHFVGNALVAMYAKCGSVKDAHHVFDNMYQRSVVSWNTIIAGYAQNGHPTQALKLLSHMQREGMKPDSVTMASVLPACGRVGALQQGKEIHDYVITSGIESDVFVSSALVDMYAKCGSMDMARQLFDKMSKRNVVSWNAMIAGYVQNGHDYEALELFCHMQQAGVKPDSVTIGSTLSACAHLAALQQGKEIHNYIVRKGCDSDVFVGSALLDTYAKCGSLEDAIQVFNRMSEKNVVSWNAMIAGYAQNEHWNRALELFHQMQLAGVKPDSTTVASVLPVCAHLSALQQGREMHCYISTSGFESDVFVGCSLIDMYAKCKTTEFARQLFDGISKRDAVPWSVMIAGYVQSGQGDEAMKLFRQMQLAGVKPNSITIASVLPACAHLSALQQGMEIHDCIFRSGFESDVFVGSALIDMYAKCGSIEAAHQVFDKMVERNVVSWNALIAGYGMHGYGEDALSLFYQMQQSGMKPNHITFIAVLSACSHAGLVDIGWQFFDSMSREYCITPGVEHYTCMVDILGRAGQLEEAHEFIRKMPLEPDAGLWGALLSACRIHCNIELGERVAEHIFELKPKDTGYYVLMSNMYAAAGRWDDVTKVRTMMKDSWLNKKPGCSWIEVKNRIYTFFAAERLHPQLQEVFAMLESLAGQMKEAGYVPDKDFVLQDVEEEDKEYGLCCHSEKLAIAYGLANALPETPIRVTKNLRVCGDCHSATKFISKIVRREIIVRDASRFHHFKDGLCSCRDYW